MSSRYNYTRTIEGIRTAFRVFGPAAEIPEREMFAAFTAIPSGQSDRQKQMFQVLRINAMGHLPVLLDHAEDVPPMVEEAVERLVHTLIPATDFNQSVGDAADLVRAAVAANP